MNQNNYIIANLNMISRIALLEDSPKSRAAIDSLIAILRYKETHETMSTLSNELAIVNHMFKLFSTKKRDAFNGIILDNDIPNTCYIKKGCILELVQMALNKTINSDHNQLEIKIISKVYYDHVDVIVQDNGIVDTNFEDDELETIYTRISENNIDTPISISVKKGVGTKVIITIPTS